MHFDFLICSERSGSNLMTKILNAHPQVCGPFPSHLFRNFAWNYLRYGDLRIDSTWETFVEDVVFYMAHIFAEWKTLVSVEELRALEQRSLAAVGRVIYEKEAADHGKSRVFVKENHTWSFIEYLLSHFPEARFLWVVRDPRDMALTWRTLASGGVVRAVDTWLQDQRGSLRAYSMLRDIGRMKLVRFEDLVTDPETCTRGVCDFLGLTYSATMLGFHTDALVRSNARRIVSWQDLDSPIDPRAVGVFRDGLGEAEIRYVDGRCAAEMRLFGYTAELHKPGDPPVSVDDLPPADAYDREQTPAEQRAYAGFREGVARIRSRNLSTAETGIESLLEPWNLRLR